MIDVMKRKTIRAHKDFLAPRDAPWTSNASFLIRLKPAKIPDDPRYGIIVSKKVFKLATERNRAKRLIRDWIAYNEDLMMDKWDYIFVLRAPILTLNRTSGREKMKYKLKCLIENYSNNAK